MCATHAREAAVSACARCGLFVCEECRSLDTTLCPACFARSTETAAGKTPDYDPLGWVLVLIPAIAGLMMMFLPVPSTALTAIGYVAMALTLVLIGIDATKNKQMAGQYVVGALLLWMIAYPLYMHRRSAWGRPKRLALSLVAVTLLLAGFFVPAFIFQNYAQVNCAPTGTTLGDGYDCSITRPQGHDTVKVCWDLVIDCSASRGLSQTCEEAPPSKISRVHVPFTSFAFNQACEQVDHAEVQNVNLELVP